MKGRFVIAALLLSTPACMALPQAIPGGLYVVKNGTSDTLKCAHRSKGTSWSNWFNISPAQEWSVTGVQDLKFVCKPPVAQKVFRLSSGQRYAILRKTSGEIELIRVTT